MDLKIEINNKELGEPNPEKKERQVDYEKRK
jgi:hypothetical protein